MNKRYTPKNPTKKPLQTIYEPLDDHSSWVLGCPGCNTCHTTLYHPSFDNGDWDDTQNRKNAACGVLLWFKKYRLIWFIYNRYLPWNWKYWHFMPYFFARTPNILVQAWLGIEGFRRLLSIIDSENYRSTGIFSKYFRHCTRRRFLLTFHGVKGNETCMLMEYWTWEWKSWKIWSCILWIECEWATLIRW